MLHQLSLKALAQPLLESIAIGLLSAIGTATFGIAPLFAQTISANDPSNPVSPFCQVMSSELVSPWGYGSGLLPALKVAIEQGGDLNQLCDFYGVQILPLNFLVSTDAILAQQLIEQGVDVNAHDWKGDTPLHYVGASVETAQLLIERGANVNAPNNDGITPLHNIFGEKSLAVMALLIERGADVNAATPEGITPLHFAYNFPMGDGAALLISEGADVNARTTENVTPLYSALSFSEVVAQLLKAGADPNIQNREGAAIHAVDISPDVLQLLLAAGVDVNVRNSLGQTALHKQRFSFEIVPLLLAADADVNAQDSQGRTPLFDVNLQVAQQLLAAGADLNIQDSSGWTPLHQAVWLQSNSGPEQQSYFGTELVELFLSEGADTTIRDNQGETALDVTRKLNRSNIVVLFPSEDGTLVGDETTDSEVIDLQLSSEAQRQVQDLLQSARGEDQSRKMALLQLSRASELAQTISGLGIRDRLLRDIGLEFVELNALAEAEVIAQKISYGAYGYVDGSRPELERAIIKAYIQSGQMDQALSIAENTPPDRRNKYWMAVIDALIDQNLPVEAAALLDRFIGNSNLDDSYRQQAISQINQVYLGAEQFEQSQAFLQARALKHPGDEVSALRVTALWAGRAGQLETALAVVRQIPANERARTFIDLARLYHYQGQQAQAKSLLDEVRQLPPADITQSWQKRSAFDMAIDLAAGYADVGLTETARAVLTDAERDFAPLGSSYPSYRAYELVEVFARTGLFDRAIQLVDSAPSSQRYAARLRLAKVYTDRGDYDLAITTLSRIPDSALSPYLERRQKLFERIVKETLKQKNVTLAKRAAQLIADPADSISVWLKISAFYRVQQQPQAAIEILDRLADNESSTAVSLVAIAEEYWAVGQREQAIETAELAIAAIPIFQPDANAPFYDSNYLGVIAKLGRNWQAPELQAAAVREMEARLEAADSDEYSLLSLFSSYRLTELVGLAYNPNQAPSELFNRNLARLEIIFEQAPADDRLTVLARMVSLYSNINRPDEARAAIEEMLPLIAALPDESQRISDYKRLAGITIQTADLEDQLKILPRLSMGQRLEVLTDVIQQVASEDDAARTMQYFDQLIQLSEQSQSQSDLNGLLLYLAYKYENNRDPNGGYAPPLPLTSAAIALLMRLPQHISDPYQQIGAWSIINRLDLPPAEADKAYEALHAKIKEIPDSYGKREMLWSELENLLNARDFERATRMAYELEDAYCRTALGWIETVRQAE